MVKTHKIVDVVPSYLSKETKQMSHSPKDSEEQVGKKKIFTITFEYQVLKIQSVTFSSGQTHTEGAPRNQHCHECRTVLGNGDI